MAKQWGVRPSELHGIDDSYEAFCFDRAVGEFGDYVMSELNSIQAKNEKTRKAMVKARLQKLLKGKEAKQQFADPAAMAGKAKAKSNV